WVRPGAGRARRRPAVVIAREPGGWLDVTGWLGRAAGGVKAARSTRLAGTAQGGARTRAAGRLWRTMAGGRLGALAGTSRSWRAISGRLSHRVPLSTSRGGSSLAEAEATARRADRRLHRAGAPAVPALVVVSVWPRSERRLTPSPPFGGVTRGLEPSRTAERDGSRRGLARGGYVRGMPQPSIEQRAPTREHVYVRDLSELRLSDVPAAGGKGANLGELTAAGIEVPPGFVVTAQAYLEAIEKGGVREALVRRVRDLDCDDSAALEKASEELRAHVAEAGIPESIAEPIRRAYRALGSDVKVAVRSSATMEDTAGTSFAGMNETFTGVQGEEEVLDAVLRCWQSLWGERVVAYRATQGLDEEPAIAVVVQKLVESERSGVMFTADPSTGDRDRVVIEGAFGLGEVVVSGTVEPDTYVVDGSGAITARIGTKDVEIVQVDGRQERRDVDAERRREPVL